MLVFSSRNSRRSGFMLVGPDEESRTNGGAERCAADYSCQWIGERPLFRCVTQTTATR